MGTLSDAFQTKSGARLELANAMSAIAATIVICTAIFAKMLPKTYTATATLMGIIGNAPGINRWSFPPVSTYAASRSDSGNALSSYNTPTSSLTVTLPPTTSIGAGWMMGFATDNGKTMNVQVNGVSGGSILYPAGATGTAGTSVTLAATNYEFLALQFDGSNFRITSITPRSAAALGMLGHQIVTGATPTVGSEPRTTPTLAVVLGVAVAATLVLGVYPRLLFELAEASARTLGAAGITAAIR